MADDTRARESGLHFCVFSHGLWGNPKHLEYFATTLAEEYPEDVLHILVAKSNTGNFTYDGIELGGERVTREIEDELAALQNQGKKVTKFSVIGYSLGGLVSRYAVGLLYSKGWFDKFEPINFITFATPHLGIRTPVLGFHSEVWNTLGSRTLSTSGRQLWGIDDFRGTGKSILSILADQNSIFMRGLSLFPNRSLYSNVVNDRAVPFYSSCISRIDPFANLDAIHINYNPDHEDVILDSDVWATPRVESMTLYESITSTSRALYHKAPFYFFAAVLVPIGSLAFLLNAGYQTYTSAQRIKAHETAGSKYNLPFMLEGVRRQAENMMEHMNAAREEEYLPEEQDPALAEPEDDDPRAVVDGEPTTDSKANGHAAPPVAPDDSSDEKSLALVKRTSSSSSFPTLALTDEQFAMIDSLDELGFKKYLVHIHKCNHSHAAMIVRAPKERFSEGKVVARHWVKRFEI